MRLLVTGASGLLGTRLCELAISKNHEVFSVYTQHMPRYGTSLRVDITDRTAVKEVVDKVSPKAIVHAAALSDVDKCEREKELAWKTNADATANMAESAQKHGAFFVYVSTDYVFRGDKGNYAETDMPAPINYYGLTKLRGEEHVKTLTTKYCIARTSVIYGAFPATGKVNFALWLLDRLKKKEEVKTLTDHWNSPTLNTNLAQMILEVAEEEKVGTYHLAGATRVSRYEFAREIAETFGLDPDRVKPASSKEMPWIAERPKDSSLNIDKAYQTLKTKPLQIHEALANLRREINSFSQ